MMRAFVLGHGFTAERRGKPAGFCRPRWRATAAILAGLALTLGAGWPAPAAVAAAPAAADSQPDLDRRMLDLVNAARAEAGAGPLTLEPRLSAAACSHARDLAAGGPLSHRGRDGSALADRVTRTGYAFAMAGENLAAGAPTPDETVWLWRGSPDHRRILLTAEFREAGIAYVPGDGRAIWVMVLAVPRPVESTQPPRAASSGGGDAIAQC